MAVLFVASAQAGAGTTALCAALALSFTNMGKSVTVFKPVASGDSDTDGDSYHKLLGQLVDGWPQQIPASGLSEQAVDYEIANDFVQVRSYIQDLRNKNIINAIPYS